MIPPAATRNRRAGALHSVIEDVVSGDSVLEALNQMMPLARAARFTDPVAALEALVSMADGHDRDPLAAYLALYALAEVRSSRVDESLVGFLETGPPDVRQHAAWALSRREPVPQAVPALSAMSAEGGFGTLMAELALDNWARRDLVPTYPRRPRRSGIRVAQVLMQGRVDADLTGVGAGDGGGLVTLQVGLAEQLADHEAVSDSFLITRRLRGEPGFDEKTQPIGEHGRLARLDFGPDGYLPTSQLWEHRSELEMELRRFLVTEGPFDAIHLRFADVGTFAASRVATELGIPIYFTLAPDPHVVIATAEREGRLDRAGFARADMENHYVFRAWMLEWMLENAERLALLPRANQRAQFRELLGVDIEADPGRFQVIPEGIDFSLASKARGVAALPETPSVAIEAMADRIRLLPPDRHGLPLIVTVGRLHRIKGMHRVVAAWSNDTALRDSFNLVVVGGELSDPSPEEVATIAAMKEAVGVVGADGVEPILLGNQSHHAVAELLAAAVEGVGGLIGPDGVYVCGSDKEEFGLAILEAMAAGLPVIAPEVGGPASYVEHGFTGHLVDTTDVASLAGAIRWGASVRHSEVRREVARRTVRDHYSLGAMAGALIDMYGADEVPRTAT